MSDADIFARFVHEMRTLLAAIEAHAVSLTAGAPNERRPQALREIARLSHAAATLAEAFAVDDLRSLAEALALAAADAADADDPAPLAPLGAHDALVYMKGRVERLAASGQVDPPSNHDTALAHRLEQTLRAHASSTQRSFNDAAPLPQSFAGAGELTEDELALVQSFPSANLRPRDEQADARLLARVTGAPVFMAQTQSGNEVPVYGGVSDDDLDDIPPHMKRIFIQETQSDLRDLGQLMLDYEQRPDELTALASMEFIAHKIKGSAAIVGFSGFARIAAAFEDVAKAGQSGRVAVSANYMVNLGRFLDIFQRALESAAELAEPDPTLVEDATMLRDATTRRHDDHTTERASQASPLPPTTPSATQPGERARAHDHELVLHIEARKLDMLMNQLSALAANRGAVSRNRSEIAHAQAEMQAALARLREKSAQITDTHPLTYNNLLATAHTSGALLTPQAATQDPLPVSPPSPSGALRAPWNSLQLEQYTEVDNALRALAEVVADVTANYQSLTELLGRLGQLTEAQEELTRDIQEDAMGIRLAQLLEITPRLRISARVAATDMGKQVDFEVRGDDIEIDRSLLEALEQPLVQIVRNAIAHGVESPDERLAMGKPATGRVWIHAYNAGNEVVIEVGDDGRGINPDLLLGAAIGARIISPEEARALSPEQALNFIFQSRVTTSRLTTPGYAGALAGSGIGLADVANTVRALKGAIAVHSDPEKGTVFEIRAPISLSMLPVLEVRAGGQAFALPFALVRATGIVAPEQLHEQAPTEADAGGSLRAWRVTLETPPLDDSLAQILEMEQPETASDAGMPDHMEQSPSAPQPERKELPAYALAEALGFEQDVDALRRMIVIERHGEEVALLVESVGNGDVVEAAVRPLPRRLRRRVVRGVVVRPEDGDVALLIDPHEALTQRLTGAEIALRPASLTAEPRIPSPSVLIVDDSVTIRRTLEQTVTAMGLKTHLAHDGYEALEVMENELPRVVILDVEMPRLSGFELLTIMRSLPQYQRVRVAMLTSRAADKHRDYAMAIGADAYLVKPCPQEILVETIRRLLTESEPG